MNEVILDTIPVVIGALIGFGASIATVIIGRLLDRQGKINIFYRITYQANMGGISWGFGTDSTGKLFFSVPIDFEFQNTSNTTRVIRDVSVILFHGNSEVVKMEQIDLITTTHSKNSIEPRIENEFFGAEKGSYSFVLPPRSIQRQKCEYVLCVQESEIQEMAFDQINLQYYDEQNKKHIGFLRRIADCWREQEFAVDEDWVLLEAKKVDRRKA